MCERAILADPQRLWVQPYPGTADQIRHVRAALRHYLGDCPVTDDAVHLLSELSANAIAHSESGKRGGTFTVRAQHYLDSYVWGEVEDQGSTWDGNLSRSARHPHGLYLLEQLASDYGVEQIRRVHVVWFRIDYPPLRLPAVPPIVGPRSAPISATSHRQDSGERISR
jgi:serine/threonine-protein kinase RsbW